MQTTHLFVVLGLLFLFTSGLILLNRPERDVVLRRIGIRRRRATASYTPPRSLSPEKKGPREDDASTATASTRDVFPPSRRFALASLAPNALRGPGRSAEALSKLAPDYSKLVPDKETLDVVALASHVTATGFTVEEIQRLGDFPDYATLSGVPLPRTYSDFDITTARQRPYRPFRWAYHQTMGLFKMEPDWWLEVESTYADRVQQRLDLYAKNGSKVLETLPGSELAAKELMEMCLQFLCARYPQHFRLDRENMIFRNGILNSTADLRSTPPMHVLLHHVPEDFAIMVRDPDTGLYSCRGGMICSSLGWTLGDKIGRRLDEIHGPVPEYKEKLRFSMDRYFAKKPTDRAIQRASWGLEIDEPLFMPPGDPHARLRDVQDPAHTVERCHLRVDWQTLRRLPLSGAVVFNYKAVFTPVPEFRDEPYIPSLVLKLLREGKPNLMAYKATWHTEHVVIPALEAYEREQIANGVIETDWEPHTLPEAPFYPDWEVKWHRQQGF